MSGTLAYLAELRHRLIRILILFAVVFAVAAVFANSIYYHLSMPLIQHFSGAQALIATSVPSPLVVPLKSAFWVTLFICIPYFLYEMWRFIAPALYQQERRWLWGLLISSVLLFYAGSLFAYFVVLPLVFKFLLAVAPVGVEVKPDIAEYLSFIIRLFFAFGVAFEVPVVVCVLIATEVVTYQSLAGKRAYILVGAFVLAMLLTPPDVISQILLAVPLYLLFELGLLMGRKMANKKATLSD